MNGKFSTKIFWLLFSSVLCSFQFNKWFVDTRPHVYALLPLLGLQNTFCGIWINKTIDRCRRTKLILLIVHVFIFMDSFYNSLSSFHEVMPIPNWPNILLLSKLRSPNVINLSAFQNFKSLIVNFKQNNVMRHLKF